MSSRPGAARESEDVVRVGLVDQHAIIERQDFARQQQLVGKGGVLGEMAIAAAALVARNDADVGMRFAIALAVCARYETLFL
jgi:hypothetical protein